MSRRLTCRDCAKEKPAEDFAWVPKTSTSSRCKPCQTARHRTYYNKVARLHRERKKLKEAQASSRSRLKTALDFEDKESIRNLKRRCEKLGLKVDLKLDQVVQAVLKGAPVAGLGRMLDADWFLRIGLQRTFDSDLSATLKFKYWEAMAKIQGLLANSGPANMTQVVVTGATERYKVRQLEAKPDSPGSPRLPEPAAFEESDETAPPGAGSTAP